MEEQNSNQEKTVEGQITIEEITESFGQFPIGNALRGLLPLLPVEKRDAEYKAKGRDAATRLSLVIVFMDIVLDDIRKDDNSYPFDIAGLPPGAIIAPVDFYIEQRKLTNSAPETVEAERVNFLKFNKAYWEEWVSTLSSLSEVRETTSHEQAAKITLQRLLCVQEVREIFGYEMVTPDFTYGPVAIMPTSMLTKFIAKASKQKEEDPLGVDVGGEDNEKANITIEIETKNEISLAAVELQNVIGELVQANGNKPITITRAQIYRAFACMPDKAKVSDKALEFVGETVDLLMEAKAHIDFTEQVEKHKNMKKEKSFDYRNAVLEGNIVAADKLTVVAGGKSTSGYTFFRQPLFYMHSRLTNQITRIDRALLDTTVDKITDATGKKHKVETRQNDLTFILLKRYLAREIEFMKKYKGKSEKPEYGEPRRSFETIGKAIDLYKVTDKDGKVTELSPLTDRQIRTLRENIEFLCTRWKIQGHIKGYELYKNAGKKAYSGVRIEV